MPGSIPLRSKSGISWILFGSGIVLVAALCLGLILVFSGVYNVAAREPHTPLFRWTVSKTMERSVRFHAGEMQIPDLSDSALLSHGYGHFKSMCVTCHGAPGKKPSEIGMGLNPQAPELSVTTGKWSDAELHWIIRNGIRMTGMPAFGATHDEREIWGLVAFVRAMAGMSPEQYEGLEVSFAGHSQGPGAPESKAPDPANQAPKAFPPFKKRSLF